MSPVELVAELHRRQGEMYAGGPVDAVVELLAEDIVWHVPGGSPIAGDHRGIREAWVLLPVKDVVRACRNVRPVRFGNANGAFHDA